MLEVLFFRCKFRSEAILKLYISVAGSAPAKQQIDAKLHPGTCRFFVSSCRFRQEHSAEAKLYRTRYHSMKSFTFSFQQYFWSWETSTLPPKMCFFGIKAHVQQSQCEPKY